MRLTGYGGLGEIGGNAFLLEADGTRVFLDIGKQFGNDTLGAEADRIVTRHGVRPGWGDYFDAFVTPRTFSMASDLLKLGLLPPMPQNLRQDVGGIAAPADIDLVVVSHAHMDHVGLIPFLKPSIPVAATPVTRAILSSIQATSSGLESEFMHLRPHGRFTRGKDGLVARAKASPVLRSWTDAPILPEGWSLESFPVDHSIHGAQAISLRTPTLEVAYTGDFRMHGRNREATERFVSRLGQPDVMLVEGTRVSRDRHREEAETDEEAQVEAQVMDLLEGRDGFVAIAYPPRDLDRLQSLVSVAQRTGRTLLVSLKQAHLIMALREAGIDLPDPAQPGPLQVYLPAKERAVVLSEPGRPIEVATADLGLETVLLDDGERQQRLRQDYAGHERDVLDAIGDRYTSARDVRAAPGSYLFGISYWTITQLFDLFDDPARASGLYIHSQTQPFNDDMMVKDRKLRRWLEAFHLDYAETHVSGHLSADDLDWVLDEVRPKRLVPVHSLAPDVTAERFTARTGHRAILAKPGVSVEL